MSCDEFYCGVSLLSVLHGISCFDAVGELAEVGLLQLPLFRREIQKREQQESGSQPENEQDVILDIFKRMDEIQEEIAHEHRRRKALEEDVHKIASK